MKRLTIPTLLWGLFSSVDHANGALIYWATNGSGPFVGGSTTISDALGPPDSRFYNLPIDATATLSNFNQGINYGDFETFLGVSAAQLTSSDFFIYERNGSAGTFFETSTFDFFSDGQNQLTVNYSNPPPFIGDNSPHASIVKQGNIDHASFDTFFGSNLFGTFDTGDIAFLLFDLDSFGVNPGATDFSVTITAGNDNNGTPDVGGVGSFATPVPEPSSFALFAICGICLASYASMRRLQPQKEQPQIQSAQLNA